MGSWWGSRADAKALLRAAGSFSGAFSGSFSLVLLGAFSGACGGSAEVTPQADAAAASDGEATAPAPIEDAGPSDAPIVEAGPDASAKGFCATRSPVAKFCDDFDDGVLEDDWDMRTVLNGEPALDTTSATSIPASFAVGTLPLDKNESAHVHLRKTANGTPTGHVVLAFDMMLATTTFTKGAIAVATLDVSPNHFFTLYLRDGDPDAPAATLEESDPSAVTTRHVLAKLPAVNVWTHVTIDIDIAAAKASVLWGTEKVLDEAPIVSAPSSDPTIRIGAVYVYGPADPFEARFDDVTLDF